MLKEFDRHFKSLTPAEIIKEVTGMATEKQQELQEALTALKAEHDTLRLEVDVLLCKFMKGDIDREHYTKERKRLVKKRKSLMEKIMLNDSAADALSKLVLGLFGSFSDSKSGVH